MTKAQVVRRAVAGGLGACAAAALAARRAPRLTAAATLALAAVAPAAFVPRHPAFGRVLAHGPGDRPAVALTFDDGPGPSTAALLDALAGLGARATFFVLGRQAERHPELIARIAREGHQLASHGYDHGIVVFRGAAYVRAQLRRTERAVERAAPGALTRLFRTPHGYRGPLTARAAAREGYRLAGWTRGVFDSSEPGAGVIARRAAGALRPGAVLLLHDADGWDPGRARPQTVAALPGIVGAARARGLALVTMEELG